LLPLDGAALGVLAGVAVAMALALLLARFLAARPDPDVRRPDGPGAPVAVALVATVAALVLWLANPYAGLLAVPAAHLWLLALVAGVQPKRRVRAALLALGALPALVVAVYYMAALSMDPLSAAWYLLLLVTGHTVGLLTAVVGCVMLGALCASIELVYRSPAEPASESETVDPPALGPGFALRR
jgi:cell division protein FtsW (lipid II flippase)